MKQMPPLKSRHAKLLFNLIALTIFALFFVTCRPQLHPQSGSDLEEAENQVAVTQRPSLTRDLADYQTYESTGLGIRLRHPPEMNVIEPTDGDSSLKLQTGNEDTAAAETQLNVFVRDSILYSDTVGLAGDNPVTILETAVLPEYEITEIVQSPTAVDLNGLDGAIALIHEQSAVNLGEVRSKYLAVILDGDRVLLLEADTTVDEEPDFLPVAQTIVNSLEVNRGPVP